jgi:death-on-curing protein
MKRPTWLLNRAVLAAHRRQTAEHGGAPGVSLLRLALALGWPKTVLSFADGRLSVYELAAAYTEALLRLRPFESNNERMAYLAGRLFLAVNGAQVPAAAAEQLAMFRALRAGVIGRPRYAQWMLMHRLAQRGAAVIGVARDRSGRVLKVGVLRRGPVPAAAGAARTRRPQEPLRNVPMLQDRVRPADRRAVAGVPARPQLATTVRRASDR